jgi:hypothetical protein
MKIDKQQLPAITAIEPQERRQALGEIPPGRLRKTAKEVAQTPRQERAQKSASFNIQLNQQLSSMQSADNYLGELATRLGQLKLSLSRELSGSQATDRQALTQHLKDVGDLLSRRSERSGNTLDAMLKLHLHEPVRSQFTLQGLESMDAIQRSGRESLIFSVGRTLSEPLAVVLDEGLSEQQILRRFNASLGQAGIRAELTTDGELKFSARESDWQQMRGQLKVRGEGKLFAAEHFTLVRSHEDELIEVAPAEALESQRELRRMLDSVVQALERVTSMREQLSQRQEEIRDFLLRQANQDEQQWAAEYANSVFNLMRQSGASYSTMTQAVVAQANISRYTVVSLLS